MASAPFSSSAILPHIGVLVSSVAERWFFTILPTKISAQYYAEVFTNSLTATSITNSLLYSGLSAFVDLVLGTDHRPSSRADDLPRQIHPRRVRYAAAGLAGPRPRLRPLHEL